MELVLEPWHWFVLGILLILSELLLPAFAALWFGDWCHYGWRSVLDVPDDGTDHPDPDLDRPFCSLYACSGLSLSSHFLSTRPKPACRVKPPLVKLAW